MTPQEAKQKLIDAGRILEGEGHGDMTGAISPCASPATRSAST